MIMGISKDYKKVREIIGEKYKFLFMNKFMNEMEVFEVVCDEVAFKDDNSVDLFSLYFNVDANYPCDGMVHEVGYLIQKIDEKILNFLYDNPMNPTTLRFDGGGDYGFSVSDGLILRFDYKLDELHKIVISYNISYHDRK